MLQSSTLSAMDFVAALRELVSAESPSADPAAVEDCARVLDRIGHRITGVRPERVRVDDGPPALAWRRGDPSAGNRVLLLGHLDTVWPIGTVRDRPLTVTDDRALGPGVFDMKAGLLVGLYAMAELDPGLPVTFLVTGDEELGSPSSRQVIEAEARTAAAVLVLEGAADGGALKAARNGLSIYRLSVTGVAAHAGLEPEKGRNALVRMAGLVDRLGRLRVEGTTVTPTLARAGRTANTVPDRAEVTVDVRAATAARQHRVDQAIHALADVDVTVSGGINRPPMERRHAEPLLRRLATVIPDHPPAVAVGGVSDGNLTAALDIPTLDGLGAVGGGAHAEAEWIDLAATTARIHLLTELAASLLTDPPDRPVRHQPSEPPGSPDLPTP